MSPRLVHATVTSTFSGGVVAVGTVCEYTIGYVTGRTGRFTGVEMLTGSLEGKKGTFALEGRGFFDEDGTVHCAFEVVSGSGTGDLARLEGTGCFTVRHGALSIPYTFDYDLG